MENTQTNNLKKKSTRVEKKENITRENSMENSHTNNLKKRSPRLEKKEDSSGENSMENSHTTNLKKRSPRLEKKEDSSGENSMENSHTNNLKKRSPQLEKNEKLLDGRVDPESGENSHTNNLKKRSPRLEKIEKLLDGRVDPESGEILGPEYNPCSNSRDGIYKRRAVNTVLQMEGYPVRELVIPFSELWFEYPICLSAYMFALLNQGYLGNFVWFDKAVVGYLSSFYTQIRGKKKKDWYGNHRFYQHGRGSRYGFVVDKLEEYGFIVPANDVDKKFTTVWKIKQFQHGAKVMDYAVDRLLNVDKSFFSSIHLMYWWLLFFGGEIFSWEDFCLSCDIKELQARKALNILNQAGLLKKTWLDGYKMDKKWRLAKIENSKSRLLSREEIQRLGGTAAEMQRIIDDKKRIETLRKSKSIESVHFWNNLVEGKMDFGEDEDEDVIGGFV